MDAMTEIMRALWIGGLAATPLALGVGVLCRAKAWSAATRHLLWLAVLVSFVTPALGWFVWRPNWFGTERLLGAAERVIAQLPVKQVEPEKATAVPTERTERDFATQSIPTTSFVGPVLLPSFTPENAARFAMGEAPSATPISATYPRHDAPRYAGRGVSRPTFSTLGAVNTAAPLGLAPASAMRTEQPARARVAAGLPRLIERKEAAKAPVIVSSAASDPVAAVSKETAVAELLRTTASALVSIRDWLASASPIPMTLWLGVAGLLIALRVGRTVRASRLIRQSEPASLRTCAMVAVAAEQIGLSRVPEVRVVDDAVSPMIWCGFTPKLILPRGLWNALDESSQRAVLVHELAHVRRWDHVLCWVDLVIGSLYWWHPLSWWARRRLHDEAEASCDAWVVNTLPESRRAYATALLATKSFVSMKGRVNGPWLSGGPAGGVGVLSGSAKKMARRIEMVMKQGVKKSGSKLSMVGAGAAACVIALGAFVMPGLACPPEGKESAEKAEKAAAELANSAGGIIVVTPSQNAKAKNKSKSGSEAGVQFFGEAPALEAMKARKGGPGFAPMAPLAPLPPTPASAPEAPTPAALRNFPSGALMRVGPNSVAIAKSGQCGASRSRMVMSTDDLKAGRIARAYVLPDGKSEAFYELMSRSDVPILVQQRGNSIVVFATEEQHPTIAGFIKIISPDGGSDSVRGSGQRAEVGRASGMSDAVRAYQAQARAYQQALRELNASRTTIERNASRVRAEADRMRAQQEQLQAAAEQMSAQAEQMEEGTARQKLETAAEKLRQRAEAAENKSQSADEKVETIEQQIEEIENRAEELEERAEELQDRISEMEGMDDDRIAELDNDVSEADSMMHNEIGELGELGEIGEPGDAMMPAEMGDSAMPEMDDEDGEDIEEIEVPAPATPALAPIPPAAPSAAPIPSNAVPAAPAPAPAPALVAPPAPATEQKVRPTPAAASVIAATRKA